LTVATFAIVAISLLLAIALLFRRRLTRLLAGASRKPPYAQPQRTREQNIEALRKLPASPLTRVSFRDALSAEGLAVEIEKYCSESLGSALSGDGLNVIVQSVVLSSNELTLVYKFSREATKLYETGRASIPLHRESGRLLPWMYDKSGKIVEQAKSASAFGLRLAQCWSLVVSVAHIISGADAVKRLKDIDLKLSVLVAGRRIDQDAALNRLYTEARGILSQETDEATIRDLKRIRYDLYQLRQVWRGEISERVRSTVVPDRSWYPSSWRRGKHEKEALESLAPTIIDRLERLRCALLTDACLAVASGTTEDFFENALPSELDFWVPLTADARQVESQFRKKKLINSMVIIREGLDAYHDVLKGLIGSAQFSSDMVQPHRERFVLG